jgi:ankyrin repeat protein
MKINIFSAILAVVICFISLQKAGAYDIFDAISKKNISEVKDFIGKNPELIKGKNSEGLTMLQCAAKSGSVEIVKFLQSKEQILKICNDKGGALYICCHSGSTDMVNSSYRKSGI